MHYDYACMRDIYDLLQKKLLEQQLRFEGNMCFGFVGKTKKDDEFTREELERFIDSCDKNIKKEQSEIDERLEYACRYMTSIQESRDSIEKLKTSLTKFSAMLAKLPADE